MPKREYEVRCGDKWETIAKATEVKNGFLVWQKGQTTGLAQPKNWRYKWEPKR